MSDVPLLTSLEPEVARLLARHNEASARIDWLNKYRHMPRRIATRLSASPTVSDRASVG